MFFLHYYRLGHGGKVCSGDYVMEEDLESVTSSYLVERGYLLWWYIRAFWIVICLVTAIVFGAICLTLKQIR